MYDCWAKSTGLTDWFIPSYNPLEVSKRKLPISIASISCLISKSLEISRVGDLFLGQRSLSNGFMIITQQGLPEVTTLRSRLAEEAISRSALWMCRLPLMAYPIRGGT